MIPLPHLFATWIRNSCCCLLLCSAMLQTTAQNQGQTMDLRLLSIRTVDSLYGHPIPDVTAILRADNKILTYTKSDENGYFELKLGNNDPTSTYSLEFNHMGYERKRIPLDSTVRELTVRLQRKNIGLEEVKVGEPPGIYQKSDTLVYRVASFADSLDCNIGEVLKRMPGFEVSGEGKISYLGKGISNFYIDGDDVLGSRYGLGTKTISPDLISNVEVYTNHQRIKVLKDKLQSDEVAINLIVKETAKLSLTGNGEIGVSVSGNHRATLNVLLLGRAIKSLNAVMANNMGEDIRFAFRELANTTQYTEAQSAEAFLLQNSSGHLANEPYRHFYQNRAIGASTNQHFRTGQDWRLRAGMGFYVDKQHLHVHQHRHYLLGGGIFEMTEENESINRPVQLNGNFNLMRNTSTNFMEWDADASWQKHAVHDQESNPDFSSQTRLKQDILRLKSSTRWIPKVKSKSVWDGNLTIQYDDKPEWMGIHASIPLPVLLPDQSFTVVEQLVNTRFFNIGSKINYFPRTSRQIVPRVSLEAQWNRASLSGSLQQEAGGPSLRREYSNDALLKQFNTTLSSSLQYRKGGFTGTLAAPIGQLTQTYHTIPGQADRQKTYFIFKPAFMGRYLFNPYHSMTANIFRHQQFGQVDDLYGHAILVNTRTIRVGSGRLPYDEYYRADAGYMLQNPISMAFGRIAYEYSLGNRNMLYASTVADNQVEFFPKEQKNRYTTHQIKLTFSKYIRFLRSTNTLNTSWRWDETAVIVNQEQLTAQPFTWSIDAELNSKIGRNTSISYSPLYQYQRHKYVGRGPENQVDRIMHIARIRHQIIPNMHLELDGRYAKIFTAQVTQSSNALQAKITYLFKKGYIDQISFQGINLLDEDQDLLFYQGSNMIYTRENRLRGRMFLLNAAFNLTSK